MTILAVARAAAMQLFAGWIITCLEEFEKTDVSP